MKPNLANFSDVESSLRVTWWRKAIKCDIAWRYTLSTSIRASLIPIFFPSDESRQKAQGEY